MIILARIAGSLLAFGIFLTLGVLVDIFLHRSALAGVGRPAAYVGTALIFLSFLHSIRKRKWVPWGSLRVTVRLHEVLSWAGTFLILVHAGVHFNALLPWLALVAMVVTVGSGLTGVYLLRKGSATLIEARQGLLREGISPEAAEEQLAWNARVVDLMKRWRAVHLPVTLAFVLLALLHVVSVFFFWRW